MTKSQEKRAAHKAKNRAQQAELRNCADWRPYRGGSYHFEFYPCAVMGLDDEGQRVTSTYPGGPQMKAIQWEPTVWEPEAK